MKKLLLATAGLTAMMTLAGMLETSHAQQSGGNPNEPFGVPINQAPPGPAQYSLPTTPGYQKLPATPQPGQEFLGGGPNYAGKSAIQPGAESERSSAVSEYLKQNFDGPDPNQDIAIRPDCGNVVICLHSYGGKDADKMAREMVLELRNNPRYKLNAFTHRSGVEECKAEQQSIRDEIERQRKLLAERKLLADTNLPTDFKVRIPVIRFEIHYAVLLAGYKDMESAKRALVDLRTKERNKELPSLDTSKVKLDMTYVVKCDEKGAPKDGGYVPVSPFTQAMVCPNPAVKTISDHNADAADMALMKKLNAQEPYSLMKCPKKLSLLVKVFSMPAEIPTSKSVSMSFMEKIGFGGSSDRVDSAAISAQNLAEMLRKLNFEGYVLHTKHSSYVTVFSYDSESDPRIPRDREALARLNGVLDPAIRLAAQPRLMAVPR